MKVVFLDAGVIGNSKALKIILLLGTNSSSSSVA
ncbi:hypothetical protein CP8484711_1305, partial [Chlamydia psittaci 84-8471/1]